MVAAISVSLNPRPSGGAGTSIYAGRIDDFDENTKLRGNLWYGQPAQLGECQKMITDGHVRAARDMVVDPVAGATWDTRPGGKRPVDIEAAAFVKWALTELLPWRQIVAGAMRDYMPAGFALGEYTTDVRRLPAGRFPLHPNKDKGVVVTGFYLRPPWSVHSWGQNEADPTKIDHVEQWVQGSDHEEAGPRKISARNLVRFTWEQAGADYEGSPIFRSIYGPWFIKRLLMRIEATGHEKNHVPMPVAIKPENSNPADDKKVEKILSAWRAHERGNIVLPHGYELSWSEHGQQTNIGATIERCNFDIAHVVGGGFNLLGRNTTGSYALAGTQKGTFDLTLNKHAAFIEDCFNIGLDGHSLVGDLVTLNYGEDVAPVRLVARNMPTVDWLKVWPVVKALKDSDLIRGDDRLEELAREVMQLPERDPDTQRAAFRPAPEPAPKKEEEVPA